MAFYKTVGVGTTLWQLYSLSSSSVEAISDTSIKLLSEDGIVIMKGFGLAIDGETGQMSGTVTAIYNYAPHETNPSLRDNLVDMITGLAVPLEIAYGSGSSIDFFAGDDRIRGVISESSGNSDDLIYGWGGNDIINVGAGDDQVYGGDGNDKVYAGAGFDIVEGNDGNDIVYGGDGDDRIFGEGDNFNIPGDDRLFGQGGDDVVDGGTSYGGFNYFGNDLLDGGEGNDVLIGRGGDDTMRGGSGADSLYGGFGNNAMSGGNGDDFFWAGLGNDRMNGGLGIDVVVYAEIFDDLDISKSNSGFIVSTSSGGRDSITNIETIYAQDGVFSWNGAQWVQTGDESATEAAMYDIMGYYG